jgi:hypothetical protein
MENVKYCKFFRSKDQGTITIPCRAVQSFWAWASVLWDRSKWIWNIRFFWNTAYIKQLLFWDSHSSAVLLFYDRNQAFYIRLSTISSKSMAHINTVLNSDMLTISHMEQNPPWEATSHSAKAEISCLWQNPQVCYCVHKSLSLYPVLSHINPGHVLKPYSFKNPKKHKLPLSLPWRDITGSSISWKWVVSFMP